jgi:gamma-glutamyltranspeptidase/glutathione hydrolase
MNSHTRSLLSALIAAACADAASLPPLRVPRGAVAADHEHASQAGAEILRKGGDAVDAAVAVLAALGVSIPRASGLGGGGFWLVYRADEGKVYALDAREAAPAAAHRDLFVKEGRLRKDLARYGGLAVAVPGEVRGMQAAHGRWGKLPWKTLFAPAIRKAREGVPVNKILETGFRKTASATRRFREAARIFQPQGRALVRGDRFSNPDLARTLEQLGEHGADWFYEGDLGEEIAAATGAHGGVIQAADLASYQARWRAPLRGSFRGFELVGMAPPSSGGLVLIQVLQTLGPLPLEKWGLNSSAYLHALAEALRHAFADRASFLGDPDHVDVPTARLISMARSEEVRRSLHLFRTATIDSPLAQVPEGGGTSHFSVMDRWGNAVAATATINQAMGSLVIPPGRGFLLNNTMDDFAIRPGEPNVAGLVVGETNAIAPGKRALSSQTPTLILKNGRPVLALGSSGDAKIITSTIQVALNVMVFGRDVQEAVDLPRIHHQWLPDRLLVEDAIPRDVVLGLEARGHEVEVTRVIGGRVNVIQAFGDYLEAACDPRKEGRPAGH